MKSTKRENKWIIFLHISFILTSFGHFVIPTIMPNSFAIKAINELLMLVISIAYSLFLVVLLSMKVKQIIKAKFIVKWQLSCSWYHVIAFLLLTSSMIKINNPMSLTYNLEFYNKIFAIQVSLMAISVSLLAAILGLAITLISFKNAVINYSARTALLHIYMAFKAMKHIFNLKTFSKDSVSKINMIYIVLRQKFALIFKHNAINELNVNVMHSNLLRSFKKQTTPNSILF